MKHELLVDLMQMEYTAAASFQEDLRRLRARDLIPDTVILVEHPPVFTVGRRGGLEHIQVGPNYLAEKGLQVHRVDRGGSITFHGFGQLVVYPIIHIGRYGGDLINYLRLLEEVVIRVLRRYDIEGRRFPPYTGVWVGEEKIAAIGVACRDSITTHGFALNVNTDLNYFSLINPCGISSYGVTSMAKLLPAPVSTEAVKNSIETAVNTLMGFNLKRTAPDRCLSL